MIWEGQGGKGLYNSALRRRSQPDFWPTGKASPLPGALSLRRPPMSAWNGHAQTSGLTIARCGPSSVPSSFRRRGEKVSPGNSLRPPRRGRGKVDRNWWKRTRSGPRLTRGGNWQPAKSFRFMGQVFFVRRIGIHRCHAAGQFAIDRATGAYMTMMEEFLFIGPKLGRQTWLVAAHCPQPWRAPRLSAHRR